MIPPRTRPGRRLGLPARCRALGFTDQVAASPVTQGVRQIWYPYGHHYLAGITSPLILGPEWTPVVRASKTSKSALIDVAGGSFKPAANVTKRYPTTTSLSIPKTSSGTRSGNEPLKPSSRTRIHHADRSSWAISSRPLPPGVARHRIRCQSIAALAGAGSENCTVKPVAAFLAIQSRVFQLG